MYYVCMVESIASSSTFEVVTCIDVPAFKYRFPTVIDMLPIELFRFRFPDRALLFPYPLPHKNMKTKVVRVFSRSFPTAFIPKATSPPLTKNILYAIYVKLKIFPRRYVRKLRSCLKELKFEC